MKITKQQLIQGLQKMSKKGGAKIISLTTETDARFSKKSGYSGTRKQAKVSGFIGYSYESVVNNKLKKEGFDDDFKAEKRTWGEHDQGLIKKGDNYYLQIKVENTKAEYFKEGKKVPLDKIAHLIRKSEFVKHREYKIDSIKSIKIDGVDYDID